MSEVNGYPSWLERHAFKATWVTLGIAVILLGDKLVRVFAG